MHRCRLVGLLLVVCGMPLTSVSARAQEPPNQAPLDYPRFGLTVGYPSGPSGASIGLVWEHSDRLALRPEVTFSGRSTSVPGGASTTDSWGAGATLSVLRYWRGKENLRPYIGPRLSLSWSSSQVTGANDSTTWSYGAGAVGGLQYALTRRISLYGEAGLTYAYGTNTFSGSGLPTTQKGHTHSVTTRSSLGLNLYF